MKELDFKKNNEQGITLVELVVTVIVLLILAALTLNYILGENGVIQKAKDSSEIARGAAVQEAAKLWKMGIAIDTRYINNEMTENEIVQSRMDKLDELVNINQLKQKEKQDILDSSPEYSTKIGGIDIDFKMKGEISIEEVPDGYIPIYTKEDLVKVGNNQLERLSDGHDYNMLQTNKYILMKNIDLNGFEWNRLPSLESGAIFNGNYKEIKKLTSNNKGGLFTAIATGAEVKNVKLVGTNIIATNSYAGGIASLNNGNINNCINEGTVSGSNYYASYIGGIVGENYGTIDNCSNAGTVIEAGYSGGITGKNNGTISNSKNTSKMLGVTYTGGITGYNQGVIKNCENMNEISGGTYGGYIGGIAGHSNTNIEDCNNTGEIYGNDYLGGITGKCMTNIINCNNSGNVKTLNEYNMGRYIGGIVGSNSKIINNCTNTGNVDGGNSGQSIAGISGESNEIKNCINKGNITGGNDVSGITSSNYGGIVNCGNIGTITGNNNVSGISRGTTATISMCTNAGNITGTYNVGGILSINNGTVAFCNNIGNITGDMAVGGIVGYNIGTMINGISSGTINGSETDIGPITGLNEGTVIGFYWYSIGSSGIDNYEGNNLTLDQMRQQSSFTEFDFANMWYMEENGFPKLRNMINKL